MVPRAVGVHVEPEQAAIGRVRRRRQHHSAAPVSEEDARPAVAPVDVSGQDVGSDDQHVFVLAAADEVNAVDDADDEAAARGGEVDGQGVRRADGGLHRARGAEEVVGGGGGEEDEVEIFRGDARRRERLLGRLRGEGGEGFVAGDDVPLADAGARADPLVVGVDELGEVVVGEVLRRDGHPDAGDLRPRGGESRAGNERRPAGARYQRGPPGVRRLTRAAGLRARADREASRGGRGHRERRHRRDPTVSCVPLAIPLSPRSSAAIGPVPSACHARVKTRRRSATSLVVM
mmetsp:Transcript_10937/g.44067  ORF Transcript_10937/g.44067 Transcript_10937/m.44067 type:complete len:290 (+) Transcript_10937:593-1462(+)